MLEDRQWHRCDSASARAFDLRAPALSPVVAFDMTNIDLAESVRHIAGTFDGLHDLIGYDERHVDR